MHKKIAIIGSGFAGLALGYFLSPFSELFFYHDLPLEDSASAIASGLLHPFTGYHYAKRGHEGMEATKSLLEISEKMLGQSVITCQGIVRPIVTERQGECFQKMARDHALPLWSKEEFQRHFPFLPARTALFIPEGLTIDTLLYLKGLKAFLTAQGTHFIRQKIDHLDALRGFDAIVIAAAMGCKQIEQTADLPIEPVRGQLIGLMPPFPLPYSLNSHTYIVMRGKEHCLIGATFEHPETNPNDALEEMKARAFILYPQLKESKQWALFSQTRATPLHRGAPLVGSVKYAKTPTYFLTGLGSKGLLYHALLARELAQKLSCSFGFDALKGEKD